MKKKLLLLTVLGSLLLSCTANTYDDIVEPEVAEEPELVTFQDVRFIFENNCQNCHSNPPQNNAPMSLVTFDDVVDAVENRGLLDRISRQEGAPGLMPRGGPRLPQATIDLVVQWQQDGLLEE